MLIHRKCYVFLIFFLKEPLKYFGGFSNIAKSWIPDLSKYAFEKSPSHEGTYWMLTVFLIILILRVPTICSLIKKHGVFMSHSKPLFICYAILFFLLFSMPSFAADRITFIYGSFYRSVETAELEEMIKTGQASGLISDVIRVAGGDDKSFIEALTKKHDVPFRNINSLVKTPFGAALLKKVGQGIFPRRSRLNGDKALSSAIIMSIHADDKLQMIELIRNYPTDMGIDLHTLANIAKDLKVIF